MPLSQFTELLNPIQVGLLESEIIHITGVIDEETMIYVETALAIMRANGRPDLEIRINSPGGDLAFSLMIHDMICSYEGPTTGLVVGISMSGGNLILQACNERLATTGSMLMVHNLSTYMKYDVLKNKKKETERKKKLDRLQNAVYRIYTHRTGKTRQELNRIFRREETLTAEEALEAGFIDEVVDFHTMKKIAAADEEKIQQMTDIANQAAQKVGLATRFNFNSTQSQMLHAQRLSNTLKAMRAFKS